MTMQVIEHIELISSETSILLDEIPQDYDDLVILCSLRTDRTGNDQDSVNIAFNGSSSNLAQKGFRGFGSGVATTDNSSFQIIANAADSTANTFCNSKLEIFNYTSSNDKNASSDSSSENNATSATTSIRAQIWANSSAITSIELTPNSGTNFLTYSSVTLYGRLAGSDGTTTVS